MLVPFQSLPPTSRVWVFQASRPFSDDEMKKVDAQLRAFTDAWVVHGSQFNSSYDVRYNQFIILAADETTQTTSGCSIDSSVRVLKELEDQLDVSLFDRNLVAFLLDGKVTLRHLKDLKELFASGILNETTLTFNNLVGNKAELDASWLVPTGQTWLKRYISNALAKVK